MTLFKKLLSTVLILASLASCSSEAPQKFTETEVSELTARVQEIIGAAADTRTAADNETETEEAMPGLTINGTPVSVKWEDNESVKALRKLVEKEPAVIQMSMYGGFEQVGPLGTEITRNDVQTVTAPGDIVLYSGSNIVIFYGSNSWSYTRLGHITDKTGDELSSLLGNGDVTITISMMKREK